VEQAEERYRVCRSGSVDAYGHEPRREGDIPAVGYWARTWFPIFIGDYILAADSRGGSVSPVWGRASHPGRLTQRLHQGIAELLRDVTDRFQRGAYAWREDLSDFEENTDLTRMDAALRPQASVTDPFTDY
jgi:hypothetical protein